MRFPVLFSVRRTLLAATVLACMALPHAATAQEDRERTVSTPVFIEIDADTASTQSDDTADTYDIVIMPDGTMMLSAPDQDLAAATDSEVAASAEKGGFPQLDTSTYSSQVFWLAISFILMYLLMARVALPRVTEVLDVRQTQINVNLERAAQLNEEATKARETFEASLGKAQETARTAVAEAEQKAAEKQAQETARFAAHARERVAKAEAAIAEARKDALNSLVDIAADVATDMVAKVGKLQVSKAEARDAVQKAIKTS